MSETAHDRVLDLDSFTSAFAAGVVAAADSWRPVFLRLKAGELVNLEAFCRDHHVSLVDTIDRQLADLAVVRLPAASDAERREFIDAAVAGDGGLETCGNWVYFAWHAKLVHLLERDDYFDVITNRNQDKITREEQLRLRGKRVGAVGLSVGGEAAVTLAQEHLCGHMVLADFDRLDLSNLNRLGAGCDELGHNKAVIVARRIARIDPYLELTLLEQGVTLDDLDPFMPGLDLVVEECDSPEVKLAIRAAAKTHGINLVFAADERGFLSVEPYGSSPDLELFHGRITQPQRPRSSHPTTLSFLKALTDWMGGWTEISERSRSSLERIGETLCGYPQLASEARYAAGQLGHVARRLLLGEPVPPFIGFLDPENLIRGKL